MFTIQIQAEPIVLDDRHGAGAERDDCGAEVRFIGKVRNDARSAPITHLVLEHFPGVTETEIQRIVDQARERWSLQKVRVVHRVGPIAVGETIVLVETASAHRRDAYEANVFIMDYLKTEAPFWKQECFADGTELWVEAKSSDQRAAERWEPSAVPVRAGRRVGALILSGGEGSRMEHRNKGLQRLKNRPMVQHVLQALQAHVEYVAISANKDLSEYAALGVPVFTDDPRLPVRGPLAGIMAAVPHFPGNLDAVMVVPCDMPLLPSDLVSRLSHALFTSDAEVAVARTVTAGRDDHHAIFMVRSGVLASLIHYVVEHDDHRLMGWLNRRRCQSVLFQDTQAFQNVNDLEALRRLDTTP